DPVRHIERRKLDKGITVRSCDLNAALDGYQPANNRQPADAPLWLVEPKAKLQPAGAAHEAVASSTLNTNLPADREANLDTTEADDMSQPNIAAIGDDDLAELAGDAPNASDTTTSTGKILQFPANGIRTWQPTDPDLADLIGEPNENIEA